MSKGLLYWLPVIIWLEIIFLLSSIPSALLPQMPTESWDFWAHRFAHIGEYSILGILVLRAYSSKEQRGTVPSFSWGLFTPVTTILFLSVFILLAGLFDEWHQSFVPGRHCQLIDAIFDTICGAWGMFIYFELKKYKK